MTVPVQQVIQRFAGTGAQVAFVVSAWTIQVQPDGVTPAVLVYVRTSAGVVTVKNLGADYTVAGQTITFGVAPPNLSDVFILSDLDQEQPDQFLNEGFLPSTVEAALDYLAYLIQQLAADQGVIDGPFTVAALPAHPQPAETAWVTDATSNTWGAAPVGGGATTTKVWYNPISGWVIG